MLFLELLALSPIDASPLVEAARTGVAKVADTEQPPQAFRNSIEPLAQVLRRREHLLRPPDADDAAEHTQEGGPGAAEVNRVEVGTLAGMPVHAERFGTPRGLTIGQKRLCRLGAVGIG